MMELLIRSSDLFVMQVEMDVYTALKKVPGGNTGVSRCPLLGDAPLSLVRLSSPAVDVPAAEPLLGRPHQTAAGRRGRLAVQTQDRCPPLYDV